MIMMSARIFWAPAEHLAQPSGPTKCTFSANPVQSRHRVEDGNTLPPLPGTCASAGRWPATHRNGCTFMCHCVDLGRLLSFLFSGIFGAFGSNLRGPVLSQLAWAARRRMSVSFRVGSRSVGRQVL